MKDKKQLFIHIGIGKTGTSSIQKMLLQNKSNLLEDDVLIPICGIKYNAAHHDLANIEEEKFSTRTKDLFTKLTKEFDDSKASKAIISSELFSYVKENYVKDMSNALSRYKVTIVFYIREQANLFESSYLQWLKVGNPRLDSPEVFYNDHKDAWNFELLIRKWEDYFGQSNIMVRLFDKQTVNNDVCRDFIDFIGINSNVRYLDKFDNDSLIADFVGLVKIIDNVGVGVKGREELMKELVRLSKIFKKLTNRKLVDKDDFYLKLRKYYQHSNERFGNKYLTEIEKNILTGKK